jgi:hypothetical protein
MPRYSLTVTIEINAPDFDTAMQYIYDGIDTQSDDAEVHFSDGGELHKCMDGCGETVDIEDSRCEACQMCDDPEHPECCWKV